MALPVAALPVLPPDDSMLTRKFGREVANYFSGSPLNRVSFLRGDHAFLQAAFAHPAARFLLVDNLAPLVHSATPPRLAWSTQADIQALTGAAPFAQSEKEAVEHFNSDNEPHPIILFLGIDEKKRFAESAAVAAAVPTFTYSTFTGNPFFAVDVTPRGPTSETAAAVIEAAKAKGFSFFQNPRSMGLSAEEGAFLLVCAHRMLTAQPPPTPRPARFSTGTPATPSAPSAASRRCRSTPAPSACARPPTPLPASSASPAPPATACPT